MNKIVAISMVKNEADVIESFARYTLTVADELLIVDHMSTDATRKILELLQEEGLPLHIDSFTKAEHLQSEVMTSLMYKAIQEFAADIVLPLDADEFILTKKGNIPVKEILRTLPIDKVYSLEWQNYFPKNYKPETGTFILNSICYRKKTIENLGKCVVGRKAVLDHHLKLSQGNHYAIEDKGKPYFVVDKMPLIYMAHFNWRSESQMLSKVCSGWLTNVARYSKWTEAANHWQSRFYKYCNGDKNLVDYELNDYEPAGILKKQTIEIKYASLIKMDVLQNVLLVAEEIANTLAIKTVLDEIQLISVVLLLSEDEQRVRKSVESVMQQSFPRTELILVDFEEKYTALADTVKTEYAKKMPIKVISIGQDKNMWDVGQQSRGEYIQLLQSGDVLAPDKLKNMATAIKTSLTGVPAVYCNDAKTGKVGRARADIQIDSNYGIMDVQEIWLLLQREACYLSGRICGFLFSREFLEKLGWLSDCFIGENILLFSAYKKIFSSCRYVGGIAGDLAYCAVASVDFCLWYQIELRLFIEEQYRQCKMEEQQYKEICKKQLMIRSEFSVFKDVADHDLYKEYLKIIG